MEIKSILKKELINLDLECKSKDEAIRVLTKMLYKDGIISDEEAFIKDVYLRESEGSTGLGNYIAIPHGKSDAVQKTSIVMGRSKFDVPWESLDGNPVRFIILFAVRNIDKTTVHLKLLSQIAGALADDDVLEALLELESKDEIIKLFS